MIDSPVALLKLFVKKLFPGKALKFIKTKYYNLKGSVNARKHPGNNVFCPCCGANYSKFINFKFSHEQHDESRYEDTYRNKMCPGCSSSPRHRIACYYLSTHKDEIL
jgi:hypothetical protein